MVTNLSSLLKRGDSIAMPILQIHAIKLDMLLSKQLAVGPHFNFLFRLLLNSWHIVQNSYNLDFMTSASIVFNLKTKKNILYASYQWQC